MVRVVSRGGWWSIVFPLAILGALFAAVLWSAPDTPPPPTGAAAQAVLRPAFERLPPVPGGHYELWVERPEGGNERLASFTVLPGGQLLTLNGEPIDHFPVNEVPPEGSTLLLLVEAGGEPAIEPSRRVLLRGVQSQADVTFEFAHAQATGEQQALLVAPTDPATPDTSGIWFSKPRGTAGRAQPGLTLPATAPGWAYGGFVTTAGGTVLPTGTFTDTRTPDTTAPFSGARKGFTVPGEDFVRRAPEGTRFPLNLADGRTVVTVSLLPDFVREPAEPYVPLLSLRIPFQQKPSQPFRLEPVAADTLPGGKGKFEQRAL